MASVGYMLKSPFVNLKRIAKYLNQMQKEMDATESVESIFAVSFHGNLPVDFHNIFIRPINLARNSCYSNLDLFVE